MDGFDNNQFAQPLAASDPLDMMGSQFADFYNDHDTGLLDNSTVLQASPVVNSSPYLRGSSESIPTPPRYNAPIAQMAVAPVANHSFNYNYNYNYGKPPQFSLSPMAMPFVPALDNATYGVELNDDDVFVNMAHRQAAMASASPLLSTHYNGSFQPGFNASYGDHLTSGLPYPPKSTFGDSAYGSLATFDTLEPSLNHMTSAAEYSLPSTEGDYAPKGSVNQVAVGNSTHGIPSTPSPSHKAAVQYTPSQSSSSHLSSDLLQLADCSSSSSSLHAIVENHNTLSSPIGALLYDLSPTSVRYSSSPERYNTFPEAFTSMEAAETYLKAAKWHPPITNDELPSTDAEKRAITEGFFHAMTNVEGTNNYKGQTQFDRFFNGNHKVEVIAARAWQVTKAVIELHVDGCSLPETLDLSKANGADRKLGFKQRVAKVTELLRVEKLACQDAIDGIKIAALVAAPCEYLARKDANKKNNARKAQQLARAKTLNNPVTVNPRAAVANTPTPTSRKGLKRSSSDEDQTPSRGKRVRRV